MLSAVLCAGRHVRTFHVASQDWEVTHAAIFHSGVVALAYPSHDTPPKLLLTTWDAPLHSTAPDAPVALNAGAPISTHRGSGEVTASGDVDLFEAMAVQSGPPVRSHGSHSALLQVRCFLRGNPPPPPPGVFQQA
jgi:hypothetical protein